MSEPTKQQEAEYRRLSRVHRQNPTPANFKQLVEFAKANGFTEQGDTSVYNEDVAEPLTLDLAIEQAETVAALRESGETEAADKVASLTSDQYRQARQ